MHSLKQSTLISVLRHTRCHAVTALVERIEAIEIESNLPVTSRRLKCTVLQYILLSSSLRAPERKPTRQLQWLIPPVSTPNIRTHAMEHFLLLARTAFVKEHPTVYPSCGGTFSKSLNEVPLPWSCFSLRRSYVSFSEQCAELPFLHLIYCRTDSISILRIYSHVSTVAINVRDQSHGASIRLVLLLFTYWPQRHLFICHINKLPIVVL